MANVRTVDFLPEIFQTSANKQFLSATLDQLIQEPDFQKTQGYVGRKIGPGVNPADRYVVEPTKTRNDYQLEPGVVSLVPDSNEIEDVITYPGINDALAMQGASIENPQRLYTSDYYTWDPMVDFDKFVNFSQYYWLPGGPLDVDVSATQIPLTDDFVVTRENGVYTFSGQAGKNPTLTLVRGGNYTFNVAQNAKETVNFRVQNKNIAAYVIDYQDNPTLTLVRGNTYVFTLNLNGIHPFYIKTVASLGNTNLYSQGVTNNGATTGTITFTVPQDAPDTLFYCNDAEFNMRGQFNIIDGVPGTGPGFWIQTDPGISGTIPSTPNISSRTILGVTNNGEDLGTVTFNVPSSTAQNFYYNLAWVNNQSTPYYVDLVTGLKFNQINNQSVQSFISTYGGIDGITNLAGRTLVFSIADGETESGGWEQTVLGDPFAAIPVPDNLRFGVWQINYVTIGGTEYIQLANIQTVNQLQKFNILFGNVYSSTSWYKNAEGYFQEIPLLTAIKDTLYYQDGTDPEIFGTIRLIDQDFDSTLDINEIIGKSQYTSPNGVTFTNGLKVTFQGDVIPTSYRRQSYYVEGVGTAIKLLPVRNFVTPETYTQSQTVPYDSTGYDLGGYDSTLNAPEVTDYLTINRASDDLNAWTRSNRWFHIDVINASAEYNNTVPVTDNLFRAKRPILEFRAGLRLFDYGTQGKQPIDIIDFQITDALSNINGTTGYSIDGYAFINGSRVIFAADDDPEVRNKIYQVEFITPDSVPPLVAQPIINLVPASDATVLVDQTVVCLTGNTLQGKSFYFDGVTWLSAQQKTSVNQAPLFNVYDADGISFSNTAKYFSSTFTGSKLFSYATATGTTSDPVLGFPLKYLSLANVGDIVFDNNLYKDTFLYVDNSVGITENVSQGFVHQYQDRIKYTKQTGWQTAITKNLIRQQFQFVYDGSPLQLDIAVSTSTVVPAVQLFVNSEFQDSNNYTVTIFDNTTKITLTTAYVPGDTIEVAVLSDQTSKTAFYQVPTNLENNPLNANSETFTLGTVRTHYETIGQNLINISGPIIGANNTRDLGNIVPYGLQILQQSSPLTMAGYFMRSTQYDIFSAIEYNNREYIKFKSQLLDTVTRNDYGDKTVSEILDSAIAEITQGRTDISPFYWSDMLPTGSVFTETVEVITPITPPVFSTVQTYNFTSSNYLGLLVYLNNNLLEKDFEYTVSTDSPRVSITVPLAVGDIITIREYANTAGNFVPNTPSKMGLYPKYRPIQFIDRNYVNPTSVIQGHDGSITVAFNDIRDEVLLEFEKRVYNNIKLDGNPIPLPASDIIPGFFRTTDYSQSEITNLLGESFLSWVGWNKLDYKAQDYLTSNPFTYNYSSAGNKINNQPLLGAWRGIYRNFYDTTSPNTTPWEMLGLSEEPTWWKDRYGPAPYTSDNLVLWDDLEAGLVADPVAPYVVPNCVRPGLSKVIPTGTEGQLLAPIDSVVGQYDPTSFRKSWAVGDGGPVEASWWSSSSYPFAVMRLLAITRPAEFFALFADRDLYKFDPDLDQYLYNGRYRLDANGIEVYGDGTSKASYINWIVDYNRQLGRNSTADLTLDLANLDVRLCYRMASFTDKQYLKIFTERSSPNSVNSSLLLPDESYNLLLYKNQPFAEITYSALIVERTVDGYAVYGYNNSSPYFQIFASASNGRLTTVSAGGVSVNVPAQYTDTIVQVPYGYVFTNTTVVVDFILSYGAYLESQGLIFDDRENGYTLNWNQMAQEFLYFSQQGWEQGTLINLNPVATKFKAVRAGAVVDTIISTTPENMLLNQNRQALPTRDLIVERNGNEFVVTSPSNQTISFLNLKFTNYENMVVLDNLSIFNDLLYDPVTASRQSRIKITASTSTNWNGQLDARGFILNQNNVKEWKSNRRYTKGEIVLYKNIYWSAQTIIQPKLEFDYNDWVKSDYTAIQKGLLPNIATKANQLANSYNINGANLEQDNDLLSYGLIGFRPREYMSALNLDDVSQVNIYKQFLGDKGTIRSAELFKSADLGKESGEYNIYENWAVLSATYGANANRSFFELRLNEALLPSDPSIVQVINPQQQSPADQTILLQDVWRQSYKLTSPDILPTTIINSTDTALPSAGYVNINDADITVFDLNNPSNIDADIESVGIGTIIWVAKVNSYDWDIYRCERVPGQMSQITNNLNGTSIVQFTTDHGLTRGDLIVIRYFDDTVNGVYRVLSVPSIDSVTVAYSFANTNQTTLVGEGLVFFLQTARVDQASDIASLSYSNELIPGAKAWVDNDGTGHWVVLEKQQQFSTASQLSPATIDVNSGFGASVAQSSNQLSALIGSPNYSTSGGIHTYRRDDNNTYVKNIILTLNAIGTSGFGNSIDFGNQTWAIAGASNSLANTGYAAVVYQLPGTADFQITQLLMAPDQDFNSNRFGYSVTISEDERWMYVSAPEVNKVYSYGRVDVEEQSVSYIGDGTTTIFNFSDYVVIDYAQPLQLTVELNNSVAQYGSDYVLNANTVVFNNAPTLGATVKISRRQEAQLDQTTYFNVTQSATSGYGLGATFTVDNTRGNYNVTLSAPGFGYTSTNTQYTLAGSSGTTFNVTDTTGITAGMGVISGTAFVSGQTVISVDSGTQVTLSAAPDSLLDNEATVYFGDILTLSYTDVEPTGSVANDIAVTVTSVTDGGITGFSYTGTGITNTTEFDLDTYLYTATNLYSFTVEVNGVLQRPHIDYDFENPGDSTIPKITFLTVPPAGAVIIVLANTYWQFVNIIPTDELGLAPDALFGNALSTTTDGRQVIIGCPGDDDGSLTNIGSVYVFDRSVVRYVIENASTDTYDIPGTPVGPIAVTLNGKFLNIRNLTDNGITTTQYIDGQVDVDLDADTITIVDTDILNIGDFLEIETNEFQLVQKVIAKNVFEEADFGAAVKICPTNCSLYVGSPLDGSVLPQAGSVDRRVNQSRVYGVTESTIANPTLTAGSTIRINNIEVAVPPMPENTVNGLISAINNTSIPNVIVSATADLEFIGDGVTKTFNIGTLYSVAESYTTVVYVNDTLQTPGVNYTYDASTQDILFVGAPAVNTVITVVSGRIVISVKNSQVATAQNKLTVLPGLVGNAFDELGFETFAWTQTIQSPSPSDFAFFGSSISVDSDAVNLVIGAPNGNIYEPVAFDGGETIFDDRSTTFFNPEFNSGVAYTFDFLPSATDSVVFPGQFAFGQQIFDRTIKLGDAFGTSVNYTSGRLLVGAPGNDLGDSTGNFGQVSVFDNPDNTPAWAPIYTQQPVVDVDLINSVFMYDKLTSKTQQYLDFINPLQGKILGAARQNIDYIGAVDPASYNVGTIHNNGNSWAEEHVGEIWWDTDTVRFIDPNQDDVVYASRRWGQTFPGSRVDIYQWISSAVVPSQYTGPGIPLSLTSYTANASLNKDGVFETRYYFWVRDLTTIDTKAGKTLSCTGISRYISNPRSSGIPYIAALDASTVAIYNSLGLISAADTILHIEFDRQYTDANVHTEYELIAAGRPDSFLNDTLYLKLQDSFCGTNSAGAVVPDPFLSPAERYGVQFRPRQSMFANRFVALENYLVRANSILAQYPITESRSFNLLNSSDPIPGPGEWNKLVANIEELSYQNINTVALGYKYLVLSDSTQGGLWTIYEVVPTELFGSRQLNLVQVQNYDTRRYWSHINWYRPGYNSSINPIAEVANYSGLDTLNLLTVPVGSSVKVTANAQGKFEIYLRTDIGWDRVGLEDGTIKFNEELWNYSAGNFGFGAEVFDAQYFDQEPVIETRKIIQSINEELFIDDLAIERNRGLMLMFDYIYTEFEAPEWLIKTSLIDVDHKIRELLPYQTYLQDNQTFVFDYINEVKPYHVQIREFNLEYDGSDQYPGMLSDFDVPAYWNTDLQIPQFISPVLLPYTQSGSQIETQTSDSPSNAEIWTRTPWNQWYANYLLSVQGVDVVNGGSGYTTTPEIVVTGECIEPAEMSAIINSAGQVVGIDIINPGSGYTTTAIITFVGGNGTGAQCVAIMGNNLVRSIKTIIKYDRCEYSTTVVDWQPNVNYENNTLVRYLDRVWSAIGNVDNSVFDPAQWTQVNAGTYQYPGSNQSTGLTGVDRTMGLYVSTVNQPGLELPLLIDGIDYPGVQVYGPDFSQNTGYDVGNYDINPFDNITYDPDGSASYDPAILDTIYESAYLNPFLGTRATDIIVDGGEYVDTYESHAPEELVPGIEFDTLDLRVYTRPGSDWEMDGHGFAVNTRKGIYQGFPTTFSFAGMVPYPIAVEVSNQTQQLNLAFGINYTIDWVNQTVTVTSGAELGDILVGNIFGLGGGNQLYRATYTGNQIVSNRLIIPVDYNELSELAIFVNGAVINNYSYYEYTSSTGLPQTQVEFLSSYTATDYISLTAIGPTVINNTNVDYSWSTPVTQHITATGSLTYTLTNSLAYTNPVNLIVNVNGVRARTAAGVEWYGDGSTEYLLPQRLGFSQSLIADPEVLVYLNDIPQILGIDYTVEPFTGGPRRVVFAQEPALGERILIAVTTNTQCYVNGDQLVFVPRQGLNPIAGSQITVTTWNDTRQQNLLTQVFVGPVTIGVTVSEGYDETTFDSGSITGDPGSFDYSAADLQQVNNLQLGNIVSDPDRLVVTLNGRRLFSGNDFEIQNEELVLYFGILGPDDTVMITQYTNSVVPDAMAFRIFQDMRGVQATYRITDSTTTTLVRDLDPADDIIYVANASALNDPNLDVNIWGVLTIDGERIMYRERDTANNTVSNLLRGTAGTAIAEHSTNAVVYNMSRANIMPEEFQDYINNNDFVGDDVTSTFTTDIVIDNRPIVTIGGSVEVRINGTLQGSNTYSVTGLEPVVVEFNNGIPESGSIVLITVINTFGASTSQSITATGSSARFPTTLDIGLVEQSSSTYVLDDFEPVIVTFDTPVPAGQVVYIANQRGAEDEFDYSFSDGIDPTFTTTINLTLPIRVFVGGIEQTNIVNYNISSLDPVIVNFVTAPDAGQEITILVRRGVTWYAPGVGTPSNGVALQNTNTKAARFLRGL